MVLTAMGRSIVSSSITLYCTQSATLCEQARLDHRWRLWPSTLAIPRPPSSAVIKAMFTMSSNGGSITDRLRPPKSYLRIQLPGFMVK
uniref:Uncharacterized protein n=1 Tax=Arundo donax TaxID=35708 RepID=A0A0A9H205_ARUDO